MRRLILAAAMAALVVAKPKPETYRETEDFQYARSSSDDGSKSGYYGAQRGNMGGNYERAHNMDLLAQHQMSGLVRQVDGELGEGAKTRTGSVYTAANSRGIYGSGNYDLSNLKGRNFAESDLVSNSQASQAYSSMLAHNSGYKGHSYSGMHSSDLSSSSQRQDSRYSGYQSLGHADQKYIDNLQAADTSQDFARYENNNRAGYNSNYHTQYGSQAQSEFDQSSTDIHRSSGMGANTQSRYITTPVKVVLRPSGRVAIPISAPTYAVSQSALSEDKNVINSDADIFNQQTILKPTNKVKHYESSYSYRKQWEKHHTQPADISVVVPTENPYPITSELHDDVQLLQSAKEQFQDANLQTAHSSHINSEHRANAQTAASSSASQTAFNSQHRQAQSGFNTQQSSASSGAYANSAYRHDNAHKTGMTADLTNAVENIDLKPKSYQSSYSYHKSWERKGDPYVIIPSTYDNQASQRLTAASANSAAYSSHHYGSHSRQGQQSYIDCDCDDEGQVRVARSYGTDELQQQQNSWDDLSQQQQIRSEKLEDLGQQTQSKWDNLEDLGQQQQSKWDNLQDLGQQTQNQWDNLQQLGQETQGQWDQFQQINQENLQNLGQQTQNKWDKLEDLSQHTQSNLEQNQNGNIEDTSQHRQKEDNFEQQANGADITDFQKNDTQQESQLNFNNWDQIAGFEQSNVQNVDTTDNWNTQKVDGLDITQQTHNTNYDDFMRPILVPKDSTAPNFSPSVNEKPNLFPLSNNEQISSYDIPWDQSTQYDFWNSHHFQNLNDNIRNNYWHPTSSDSGLNSLNLMIDNIAREFSRTGENNDKNVLSQDSSNFYSHNQNVNQMQNGYSWDDTYSNFQSPQQNTDNVDKSKSEHHNLFDEQTNDISTTTMSNIPTLTHSLQKPTEIADTFIRREDVKPHFDKNKRIPSPDAGRGDIGPEEASSETMMPPKPYKTPKEIDSLSLTKEKPDEIIIHPSVVKPKIDNTGNTLSVININAEETMRENRHNSIIETSQARVSTTNPTSPIFTTTDKSNIIDPKPISNYYHSTQNQRPQENVEIPEDVQQENLEQKFKDFNQQSQISWFANENLPQGYDQQNMEQQLEVFQQHVHKPYKIPEELNTLSLTREKPVIQADTTVQQNIRNFKDEDTVSKLSNINNLNYQNRQFQSTTPKPQITTTNVEVITTAKSNTPHSVNTKPPKVMELHNKPLSYLHDNINKEKPVQSIETPADIQQENLEQQFEDFDQQLQGAWLPSDNLQQSYEQQNTDQQFEVFHQEESLPNPSDIQDFGQQEQRSSQGFEDLQVGLEQGPERQIKLSNLEQNSPPSLDSKDKNVSNPEHVEPKQPSLQPVPPAVETETEKPGFWKSVGSKFSNAKDKVFSWFKQS